MSLRNIGNAAQPSGLSKLLGGAGKIAGLALGGVGGLAGSAIGGTGGAIAGSAIQRRLDMAKADKQATLHGALGALKDPSVPDYVREAYAEPLLRAKYFGGG